MARDTASSRLASTSVLWASAFVLAALLIMQAGKGTPAVAFADVVNQGNEFGMLSVVNGSDDILVVLDQRSEDLLVYSVVGTSSLDFKGRQSLKEIFFNARQGAGGGK